MPTKLLINGRFLTRQPVGVDRVAFGFLTEFMNMKSKGEANSLHMTLALPGGSQEPNSIKQDSFNSIKYGKLMGHIWEQIELLFLDKHDWLFSPCNTGPIFRSKQIVIIHDAQVFTSPNAYSRLFRIWYKILLPMIGRKAKLVLTVSEYSKLELEKYGVAPKGKIKVIPNGIDHINDINADSKTLERYNLETKNYLLAIGSLSPHKNLSLLIEAAKARNSVVKLVIAGGANSKIFADHGLESSDSVQFLGRVTDEELKALYENALALAFPSITEGFGLPPLEAMACGCPVIASTGGAIPEACGDAAIYCEPFDQDAWTKAMEQIETEADYREELIRKGMKRAKHFTWAKASQLLHSFL